MCFRGNWVTIPKVLHVFGMGDKPFSFPIAIWPWFYNTNHLPSCVCPDDVLKVAWKHGSMYVGVWVDDGGWCTSFGQVWGQRATYQSSWRTFSPGACCRIEPQVHKGHYASIFPNVYEIRGACIGEGVWLVGFRMASCLTIASSMSNIDGPCIMLESIKYMTRCSWPPVTLYRLYNTIY